MDGKWIVRDNDGKVVVDGSYTHGKEHGHWLIDRHFGTSSVYYKGSYVHGEKHGHWVEKGPFTDYAEEEGTYLNGKKHGKWVVRKADGTVVVEHYEDGWRQ